MPARSAARRWARTRMARHARAPIFRVLLPMIDGFADDPPNRAAKLAAAHVRIVQQNVFEPVGAQGVDTKPPATGPQASGYAFSDKYPGSTSGGDWGDSSLG